MRNTIKLKLDEIAECIYNKVKNEESSIAGGLYSGDFGNLLFLYYYSRYSKESRFILETDLLAEGLIDKLGSSINLHTFCGGLSGVLYLFEFLKEDKFIDIDISDVEVVLEEFLIERMRKDILNKNYDFMHGALGVGLYFLKKKTQHNIIKELIDYLYTTAEVDEKSNGLKWISKIDIETNMIGYNISLSHGMSSIVLFLCRAMKNGFIENRISELLQGAVRYILFQEIDHKKHESFFPSFSIESSETLSGSRLAWCYGDLGVGYAIWQAGKVSKNKIWEEKGLNILLHSTSREGYVSDAGICHGCASMILIYKRMYVETNIQKFSDAMEYWIQRSLRYSCFDDGLAGYKTYSIKGWLLDYSLLTGIAGIGMTFISYLNEDYDQWDEIFLL